MANTGEFSPGQQTQEVELRNQQIEIPVDRPLVPLDEARESLNINAAVLAEFTVPVTNDYGEDKVVQLLDFGDDVTEHGKELFSFPEIKSTRGIGVTRSRFALMPGNYTPTTHMIGFKELSVGKTTIGRDRTSHPSYLLGLSNSYDSSEYNKKNETLSREHFTVEITEDGRIIFTDHSTNGTIVKLAG
jgi:hypothetical protein